MLFIGLAVVFRTALTIKIQGKHFAFPPRIVLMFLPCVRHAEIWHWNIGYSTRYTHSSSLHLVSCLFQIGVDKAFCERTVSIEHLSDAISVFCLTEFVFRTILPGVISRFI